jgi:hypothetical protein
MLLFNQLNEFQPFLYRGGILIEVLVNGLWVVIHLGSNSPMETLFAHRVERVIFINVLDPSAGNIMSSRNLWKASWAGPK